MMLICHLFAAHLASTGCKKSSPWCKPTLLHLVLFVNFLTYSDDFGAKFEMKVTAFNLLHLFMLGLHISCWTLWNFMNLSFNLIRELVIFLKNVSGRGLGMGRYWQVVWVLLSCDSCVGLNLIHSYEFCWFASNHYSPLPLDNILSLDNVLSLDSFLSLDFA